MQLHWLAPVGAALLGLALLPLLAHLIRRPPKDKRTFGAQMLLRKVLKHNKKRNRIHDWLLLLIRILLLFLLGSTNKVHWKFRRQRF